MQCCYCCVLLLCLVFGVWLLLLRWCHRIRSVLMATGDGQLSYPIILYPHPFEPLTPNPNEMTFVIDTKHQRTSRPHNNNPQQNTKQNIDNTHHGRTYFNSTTCSYIARVVVVELGLLHFIVLQTEKNGTGNPWGW